MWSLRFIEMLIHDLRYGARTLLNQPGFTLLAVLTLGLGIGSTTTIFSAVWNILLNPFPYPDAHRMVAIRIQDEQKGERTRSPDAGIPRERWTGAGNAWGVQRNRLYSCEADTRDRHSDGAGRGPR
jgi:hypothetical protein